MAETAIRTAVKTELLTQISAEDALDKVQVGPGFPAELEDESVWVNRITGKVTLPVGKAGRRARDDKFTITFVFMSARPGDSAEESEARVEGFYSALEDVLAADFKLGGIDGLESAVMGNVEGPVTDPTTEGHASFMAADVDCHARLT